MLFQAKALVPAGNDPQAAHPVFDQAARDKVTLINAPEDYLLTEGLAATLSRAGRRPIWLRLGPQDRDPGPRWARAVFLRDLGCRLWEMAGRASEPAGARPLRPRLAQRP